MIVQIYNMVKKIQEIIRKWQREKEYQRKLKELKKRDPFTYKNF
tara:strand:- start:359 stop:490 length:132 start_codon:yes stop_codon:yes gene_type:complete